jgi:hypothetical protein
MKRPIVWTALALATLLVAVSCEQPAGTGARERVTVRTAEDLAKIGKDNAYPPDGEYTLAEDITLEDWSPIGTSSAPFTGTFNGGGHTITISAISSDTGNSAGIFGFTRDASIRNLKVAGTITKIGTGSVFVGGIVGNAENTGISFCTSSIDIAAEAHGYNSSAGGIAGFLRDNSTIANCSASGNIRLFGENNEPMIFHAGGIAGYQGSGGVAEGDSNSGCVISRCSFTGTVSTAGKYPYAGGIAGYNYAGSVIRECYATGGTVVATGENLPYAGGISGYNSQTSANPALIENCWSDITVSAVATSKQALAGGISGSNAAGAAISKCYSLGSVTAKVDGSSEADSGGSLGVPAAANAGGIAGAQYFGEPSIQNCAALNTAVRGEDSGAGAAYNVHRIAGTEPGGSSVWAANIASVKTLTAGGSVVTPVSASDGHDGLTCVARPTQTDYEDLGWDFATVWAMAESGYPVLRWQQ